MAQQARRMIHCINCGSIIEEDCDFCYFCGQDPREASTEDIAPITTELIEEAQQYQREDFDFSLHGMDPVYQISGVRGRKLVVYKQKAVIKTDVTIGSILTNNATDGEKTIYFRDVIGVQFKPCGLTIGYLQLETASAKGNNTSSNFFDENTFTFEKENGVYEAYRYIISRLDEIKSI